MTDTYQPTAPAQPPAPPAPAVPGYLTKYTGQMEGIAADERQAFEGYQSSLAKPMSALSRATSAPIPQSPTEQPVPAAPKSDTHGKDAMAFASAMAVLGAISSRFARVPGQAALSAFAGAMSGWQQGNREAYEASAHEWEQNTKKTIENNRMVLDKYRQTLENRKLNIDQQMSQIQLIAAQYQDKMTFDAAQSKNYTLVAQLYEKQSEFTDKANRAAAVLQAKRDTQMNTPLRVAFERFMEEHPNATSEEIQAFVQKGKAVRSPQAVALSKYLEEHPNATSEDISKFSGEYGATTKAARDFATGKQGQQINSLNVGISHLETLRELGAALKNGDMTRFNAISQQWASETGNPAPTNFDTAKNIVGAEVMKALVAGGGGVSEREEIRGSFSRAGSPAAINGAIDTAERLLAGQFVGLKKQYEQTTHQTDFDARLTDEALKSFKGLSGKKDAPVNDHSSLSDEELKSRLGL